MKKLWVGGATGFLGSELVRQLAARGDAVVAASASGGSVDGVEVARVDATDAAAVAKSAAGCEGAFFAVGRVSRDPGDGEALYRANVLATKAGLAGLRQAGVRRVVFASSSGTIACGTDPDHCHTEDEPTPHALITRWPYYRSKLYAERAALELHEPGAFEVVVVNPSLLLGPGDRRSSSTTEVRQFLAGALPATTRGGLAFVDVRDAAKGMIAAFELGHGGQRYLLSAANMAMPVFFDRLSRLSGKPAPVLKLPKKPALALASHALFDKALRWTGGRSPVSSESVDVGSYYWYCDCSKAHRELHFEPRDGLTTLRDTIADILSEPSEAVRASTS